MANFPFPLQILRQYAGPVDVDAVFSATVDRINYLSNPRRYAGQIVADLEDGNTYVLSTNTNNWINTGSKYLPLAGGTITGNLNVEGTFTNLETPQWNSVYTNVRRLSADWNSVYSSNTVTSADWNSVYSSLKAASANYQGAYTTVYWNSGNWGVGGGGEGGTGILMGNPAQVPVFSVTPLSMFTKDQELVPADITYPGISAFTNLVRGITYTLTNKTLASINIYASPYIFVRKGSSWRSTTTSLSGAYLTLPVSGCCSFRADTEFTGSVW